MPLNNNTPTLNKKELTWHSLALCTSDQAISIIPIEFAKTHSILPMSLIKSSFGDALVVASSNLKNEFELKESLKLYTDKQIIIKQLPDETLSKAISFAYQKHRISKNKELIKTNEPEQINEVRKSFSLSEVKESLSPKILQSILIDAIDKKASDIHLDNLCEKIAQTHFRIDGRLQEQNQFQLPGTTYRKLLRHILVLCELDITKLDSPQEGMFELSLDEISIRLRISSLPTVSGNKLAIRLLYHPLLDDTENQELNIFDVLHIPTKYQMLYQGLLKKKGGLILLSGPTGSGKSTLLYSLLQLAIKDRNKNIITIEDPVERKISGATQIELNNRNALTYGNILKSLLRQDPDMVVLSEIRDSETATTALESALSGILILSTIHASNVPELILRLLELSCPPLTIASTVKLISSQRLLRKLCEDCKAPQHEDSALRESLKISSSTCTYLSSGCPSCNYQGIDGRIAVYEFCEPTFELISSLSSLYKSGLSGANDQDLHKALQGSRYLSFASSLRNMLIQGVISEEEAESILF